MFADLTDSEFLPRMGWRRIWAIGKRAAQNPVAQVDECLTVVHGPPCLASNGSTSCSLARRNPTPYFRII